MKTRIALLIILVFIAFNFYQCKDDGTAFGDDRALFDEASAVSGFTYYQGSPTIRASSTASGHRPYMRVKFNDVAQNALGLDGRLPTGSTFPNGSLIVKELFDSFGGVLQMYAVMKKDSLNPNAGANWLWAEYYPDQTVAVSVTENGAQCVNCHSTNSRDYVRVFNIF